MTGSTARTGLLVAATTAVDLLFWYGEVRLSSGGMLPAWVPPVATLLVHQSLWLRPRVVTVFWIQCAFAFAVVLVPLWQPFAGLLVATWGVARHTPTGRVALAATLPLFAHGLGTAYSSVSPWEAVLVVTALWWAAATAVWMTARHQRGLSLRLRRWHDAQASLLAATAHAERLALARDLHDSVANTITTLIVQAAAARTARAGAALDGIEVTARRAMHEMQGVLGLLPRQGYAGPLLADLPALVDAARAADLPVALRRVGARRPLSAAGELLAYRVVQEGLTNSLKYAPPGARAVVTLRWTPERLDVSVTDAVRRTPAPPPRHVRVRDLPATGRRGLEDLAERARLMGGHLESGPTRTGFRLAASIPVAGP